MVLDIETLLLTPLSDGGCIGCGRALHDDDARVYTSLSRFDLGALICSNCTSGRVADEMVLFPND